MTENDKSTEAMIQAAGLTAPRLSPDSIRAVIASEHYFTAQDGVLGASRASGTGCADSSQNPLNLVTFCVLILRNGFTVTGKNAVISHENFREDIGRKVAFDDAFSQIWSFEGYLLKQRLFEESQVSTMPPESTRPAHQQRVVTERDELADKITKLSAFLPTATFHRLADEEQIRLQNQLEAMRLYCAVLNQRIDAFPV